MRKAEGYLALVLVQRD